MIAPKKIEIQVAEKLVPLLQKKKRIKIAVGGRGGTKSVAFADAFLKYCDDGERLCCAREFQKSIDQSVYPLLKSRISALNVSTVHSGANKIYSDNNGEIFFWGLARNVESLKSMYGVKRIWIEEAAALSQETVDLLGPTIREAESELWLSLNRGSSKDPVAVKYLKPYEKYLAKDEYYEDDDVLIVQINWQDNPWFPEVLEKERQRDKRLLSRAKYDHIWNGAYSDSVENAIIEPEWFDACVDAHIKLGIKPEGVEVVAYDPADSGDAKGLVYRHGNVILDVRSKTDGDVNDATDWAIEYANRVKTDHFIWDGDGMGTGLKRQIITAFSGKKTIVSAFHGGSEADFPESIYMPIDNDISKPKTNRETFYNKRAQYYGILKDMMFKTYLAVVKGMYIERADIISISSKIDEIANFRAEVCRIPRKHNSLGRFQLMTKKEMKQLGIDSPNLADPAMMSLAIPMVSENFYGDISYPKVSIA